MGAPTGSFEVVSVTRPTETGLFGALSVTPVISTVAGCSMECCLMMAQVSASGIQVCAAACSSVSEGSLLFSETQRGSILPIWMGSPGEVAWIGFEPSAKVMATRQVLAEASASRQIKVGGMMSGGK